MGYYTLRYVSTTDPRTGNRRAVIQYNPNWLERLFRYKVEVIHFLGSSTVWTRASGDRNLEYIVSKLVRAHDTQKELKQHG